MTTLISDCPRVFDAHLPTIAYDHLTDPEEAHRAIADARAQAPIAMGPHGPEVLSYELVRTVLRDNRFITAQGLGLALQGITSGPLWDRATSNILGLDGAEHHRLRRLVSKAFAPRAAESQLSRYACHCPFARDRGNRAAMLGSDTNVNEECAPQRTSAV